MVSSVRSVRIAVTWTTTGCLARASPRPGTASYVISPPVADSSRVVPDGPRMSMAASVSSSNLRSNVFGDGRSP
jgi:hypothetical protein